MPFSPKLPKNLVIIGFSDTHGDPDKLMRLYTLIKGIIERDKANNPNVRHILLVPGDIFSVNAVFSTMSEGEFDVESISKIAELFNEGDRFFTPGNHDFYYGESKLLRLIQQAKFRVIISNTIFNENTQLKYEPFTKLLIDGEEVTIAGLMTPETLNTGGAKKVIKIIDPSPVVFEHNPPTILMSHLGSKSDKSLPYQTIVFGGHTHDRQIDYQEKKLVINTGAGECIVAIRGSGPQTEIETTIIEAAGYAPSPVIKALIARYEEKYRIDLNKFIFSITPDSVKPSGLELSEEEAQTAKSHLRINDALITRATADAIATGCDHIDFALYPVAAIRSNFQPDQKIDLKLLFSTYYYDNTLAAVSLTGAELITLLAHGIMSGYKCWENRGQLLIPSAGLTYHYDISVDPGKTIQWVKIKGKFIDPDAKFTFVTTNWIAEEVLKLFPAKALTPYPKELKIFSLVATHLQDSVLKESFGERVTCNQSFKEQLALAQQPGNLRKDKPPFDRYKVLVDIDSHRHYFLESLKNISQNPSTLLVAQPTAAATEENRLPPTSAMA